MERFGILVDSNEFAHGKHWQFPNNKCQIRSLLKYGCDYAVAGQLGLIGVERKSFMDFVKCCGKGRPAFMKQIAKLQKNKYHCVIVEGNITDPITHGRMRTGALVAATSYLATQSVPVIFAGSAARASAACLHFFKYSLQRIRDGEA